MSVILKNLMELILKKDEIEFKDLYDPKEESEAITLDELCEDEG